jgi:oxygen-independent coproporphyrinogen III oxidase
LAILKKHFQINPNTEIAVEITTSQMTDANYQFLLENQINRIHIGVQTLAEPIRRFLGRRESADIVRSKLKNYLSKSFITSVDMLYGLPTQTSVIFLHDLQELIGFGVDGFALYELQVTRSLSHVIDHNSDKTLNYQMLMQGKKILNTAGYRNVFFNHLGKQRDQSLYFTFPIRQEDCLALGTIADGKIGSMFYRHKKYKPYLASIAEGTLGIDSGFSTNELRDRIYRFETELMSTHIPLEGIKNMEAQFGDSFKGIFDLWLIANLIRFFPESSRYELTGSGCWLLSSMIEQVRRLTTN